MRDLRTSALTVLACSAILQFLLPSTTDKFAVRTVSVKKALYLSISKSSPPLAALEDAQLSFSVTEAPNTITLEPVPKNVRVLPGLRISQREIEREIVAQKAAQEISSLKVKAEPPVAIQEYSAPRQPRHIDFKALMNKVRGESTASYYVDTAPAKAQNDLKPIALATSTLDLIFSAPKPPLSVPPNPTTVAASPKNSYTDASYDVSGSISLAGLSLVSGNKLVVYREVNGRPVENSLVDINKPSFHLKTKMANGFIVGELRTQDDVVLASDEKDLDLVPRSGQIVAQLALKLRPKSGYGASGRASSASGGDLKPSPVEGAEVSTATAHVSATKKSGKFEIGPLLPDSSMIVKSEKRGFYGTLMLASARQSLPIQMYPQKMVSALIDLVGAPSGFGIKDFNRFGIVWGRVSGRDGAPIDKAKVEITDNQALGPIYFNDFFLPDSKLTATSSNGMFVFLRVQKGTSVLRANQDGRIMPSRIVPVEPLFVSHVELEAVGKQKAQINTFDAFTKTPVPAEVRFAGAARTAKTNSQGQVISSYAKNADPLILEVDPTGDYAPVRFHAARVGDLFEAPQISNEWLNSLKLNQGPDSGSIVGFIGGQRFDVFMDIDGKPHEEIYYFNASGEITPVPVLGGGFIIGNVPSGLRTVSIVPEGSPAIYSQVLSVDPSFISVMNKSF